MSEDDIHAQLDRVTERLRTCEEKIERLLDRSAAKATVDMRFEAVTERLAKLEADAHPAVDKLATRLMETIEKRIKTGEGREVSGPECGFDLSDDCDSPPGDATPDSIGNQIRRGDPPLGMVGRQVRWEDD